MSDTVLNDNKTVDIKADLYNRYIKAFEGNSAALCELGHMYKYGYEIEQNYSKAFACYKLASDKGNVYAKQCLALMYYYGEGVKQDISKAKELYKKGFSGNNKEFQFFYSILGDSLFKPVLSDALEKNDLESQLEIAQFLYQQGYPQAYRKAFEWYMKAAEQGSPKAKYFLGNLYYNKKFENYDPLTAKKYLEASAENNVASAQYLLGKMYLNGDGVEKNYEKALEWFEKAAENRNEVARKNLPHYRNLLIPLAAAVKENTIDIIRKYIEEGNDVNKQYENDETLMMIAARYNSIEAAKVLYEAGAVIDAEAMTFSSTRVCYVNNKTPLMVAAIYNSIDVANFFNFKRCKHRFQTRIFS
ncbi:hypothetical protein MSI_13400 [Treponema sp. JC4]|uniref:ankyrin repeat domain-containing protein n=1 Tax=Treponema sp. JC4 TaxID=1124982 RepID=UPI00025B0E0A|nr:ankyrin repeat domain-containing protein [Treponema sp. JC4]EID85083.1 hypothetical protein MSI_13400 [Treponema sp. JC4]